MAGPEPPRLGGPLGGPLDDEREVRAQKQQKGLGALDGAEIPVKRRRNALILPTDDDWKQVENFFIKILRIPAVTTGAILSTYFDDHDRTIFVPVTSPASLVDVQEDHTRRYRINLATRFRGHTVTLATKFSMLYFGLPVEPLMSQLFDPVRNMVEEADDSGLEGALVRPPLHFLTAHDQRNFGIASKSGRVARFSTVPVSRATLSKPPVADVESDEEMDEDPVLGLRGGDLDESDIEMVDGDDEMKAAKAANAARYYSSLRDPRPWLLGFQGRSEISTKNYYSVFDSIRCLLSVQPEVSTDIVIHKIEDNAIAATWTFPDPETAYQDAVMVIQEHAGKEANHEFFIHRIGELPPAPGHMKPTVREDNVFRLHGVSCNGMFREAYLRLPPKKHFHHGGKTKHRYGANDYMQFFHAALSVIHGQPYFLGDLPHSMLTIEGYTHASDEMVSTVETPIFEKITRWPASYGGFELDSGFLEFAHLSNNDGPLSAVVKRRDLEEHHIVLIIPGAKISELIIEVGARETYHAVVVLQKIRDFFTKVGGLESLLVHHGRNFYNSVAAEPYRWCPFPKDGSEVAQPTDAEFIQYLCDKVKRNPKTGRCFFLQPIYTTPSKIYGKDKTKTATLDEAFATHDAFNQMLVNNNDENGTLDGQTILVRQVDDEAHWNLTNYVIRNWNTDEEVREIRRFISARDVQYEIVVTGISVAANWARALSSIPKSLFGPRYGLITAEERVSMCLDALMRRDDPYLVKLRKDWATEKAAVAAAAADAVSAQRRLADPSSPAAGRQLPKKWDQKGIFNKHLPQKKDLRVQSWSRPQSLFDGDGEFHPYIPLNSAPIESMLRVSKGQSVPMVSKAVLTPSEQRELQVNFHAMRNLNLTRIRICQYQGCNFQCRSDDTKSLLDHQETHVSYRCPWCPDKLFQHSHAKSRDKHLREKHADKLAALAKQAEAETVDKNDPLNVLRRDYVKPKPHQQPKDPRDAIRNEYSSGFPRPSGEPVTPYAPAKAHAYEKEYPHCDRCGRDHGLLNDKRDRAHHDRRCVPHAKGAGFCGFCKTCGDREWATKEHAIKWDAGVEFPHRCYGLAHDGAPHCQKCSISLKRMPDEYIDKHRANCKGYGGTVASFCPYCAEPFVTTIDHVWDPETWFEHRRLHITACRRKLRPDQRAFAGEMTPFDLYDKVLCTAPKPPYDDLWDGSRRDKNKFYTSGFYRPSRYLGEKLEWYEKVGDKPFADPLDKCTVNCCGWTIGGLMPNGVLNHFQERHGDGSLLKACPICDLSFRVPGEGPERYDRRLQEKHMECHIWALWDIRAGRREKWKFDDFDGLRGKDGEVVKGRCPHFKDCGAIITGMSGAQWETHVRRNHPELVPWSGQTMDTLRSEPLPEAGPGMAEAWQLGPAPKRRPTKQPAQQQPIQQQPIQQQPVVQQQPVQQQPIIQTQVVEVSLPIYEPPPLHPDDPLHVDPVLRQARLLSVLGDVTVPEELYKFLEAGEGAFYCSRCLRPVHSCRWRDDPTLDAQMAAHLDINNRSCRIPNVRGVAMLNGKVILPNQTGWIHKDMVPKGFDWEAHGKKWLESYPHYHRTMFKFRGKRGNKWNKWDNDPNNRLNDRKHAMPFPPPGYDPLKPVAGKPKAGGWVRPPKPTRRGPIAPTSDELEKELKNIRGESSDSDDSDEDDDEEEALMDEEYVRVEEETDEDEEMEEGREGEKASSEDELNTPVTEEEVQELVEGQQSLLASSDSGKDSKGSRGSKRKRTPTAKAATKVTPKAAPKAAPKVTPKGTAKATPKSTTKAAPKSTTKAAPKATPKTPKKATPRSTRKTGPHAKMMVVGGSEELGQDEVGEEVVGEDEVEKEAVGEDVPGEVEVGDEDDEEMKRSPKRSRTASE
jgi:hypothetical protein